MLTGPSCCRSWFRSSPCSWWCSSSRYWWRDRWTCPKPACSPSSARSPTISLWDIPLVRLPNFPLRAPRREFSCEKNPRRLLRQNYSNIENSRKSDGGPFSVCGPSTSRRFSLSQTLGFIIIIMVALSPTAQSMSIENLQNLSPCRDPTRAPPKQREREREGKGKWTTGHASYCFFFFPVVAVYGVSHPEYAKYLYVMAPISLVLLNPIGFLFLELGARRQKNQLAALAQSSYTNLNDSKMSLYPTFSAESRKANGGWQVIISDASRRGQFCVSPSRPSVAPYQWFVLCVVWWNGPIES